jgi:transposase
MKSTTLWVGVDVHKETLCVSMLPDRGGEARPTVTIPNRPADVRRLFARLAKDGQVRACYEAGSCGYELYRQLAGMDIACDVIAPALIPVRAGDRVKTDRRDAEKLARLYRAGELTSIRVPTEAQEALRDLVRCREDLREDVVRERQRLLKFLLRHGRIFSEGTTHWTLRYWAWLRQQRFNDPTLQVVFDEYLARLESTLERLKTIDQEIARMAELEPYRKTVAGLRCLRGIDTLTAVSLVAEVFDFQRFGHADEFMAFVGLVPSERSSGAKQHRGSITKTGNSHVRRLLVEAAWHYRQPARLSPVMRRRWQGQPESVVAHAKKAQERLYRRFVRLTARSKPSPLAVTAVARELAGFVWAIGAGHA